MIDFQKQVIERSFDKPVVVDFWAPWCGPCRVLGPILEQLAEEQQERWELVKLNTEEQPGLAQEYGIMSIPNVKLFHRGEVIDEFTGALPRVMIERWLESAIPDPGITSLQAILEAEETVPDPEIEEKLQAFLQEHPGMEEVKVALARHLVFRDPEKARELVAAVSMSSPLHGYADDVRTLADFLAFRPEEEEGPVGSRLLEAQQALQANDAETTIAKIIEATSLDKAYQKELPRRTAIALFHLWGAKNELTKKYRRMFDMALY